MELELKHFKHYLGHNVMVRKMSDNDSPISDGVMQGLSTNGVYLSEDITPWAFNKCLLHLRPFSQLVEEIEHNGENFIPLVELARLFYVSNSDYKTTHFDKPRETFNHNPESYTVNCCVENDSFRYMYYSVNRDVYSNNYNVVNKFKEWGFDIEGLLEQGKAIEKTNKKKQINNK